MALLMDQMPIETSRLAPVAIMVLGTLIELVGIGLIVLGDSLLPGLVVLVIGTLITVSGAFKVRQQRERETAGR